jgi:raffinose/stachyose/melibiose transport system permease protein
MLAPAFLLYLAFMVIPAVGVVFISLFRWSGLGPLSNFVGLDNYISVLFRMPWSSMFWNALRDNLFILVFGTVTLHVPAILLALLVWRRGWSGTVFKTILLLPFAISPVVIAVLWKLLLNPQAGALQATLTAVGLGGFSRPWLGDPFWALPVVTLIGNWQVLGFNVLMYNAAMAAIPIDVIDAARLDAGTIRTYWHVVLPLIRSTMITLLVLMIIWSFSYFEYVYLITGGEGGPFFKTDVLGTLFYRIIFGGTKPGVISFGEGAAVGTIMLLLVVPTSIVLVRLRRRFDVAY